MKCKYRHERHNRAEKRIKDLFPYGHAYIPNNGVTENQVTYVRDLFATCDRVGIDTSFLPRNFGTKAKCNATIHALYTLLEKNGYDNYGNKKGDTK
jgi:hypothetical protein